MLITPQRFKLEHSSCIVNILLRVWFDLDRFAIFIYHWFYKVYLIYIQIIYIYWYLWLDIDYIIFIEEDYFIKIFVLEPIWFSPNSLYLDQKLFILASTYLFAYKTNVLVFLYLFKVILIKISLLGLFYCNKLALVWSRILIAQQQSSGIFFR